MQLWYHQGAGMQVRITNDTLTLLMTMHIGHKIHRTRTLHSCHAGMLCAPTALHLCAQTS